MNNRLMKLAVVFYTFLITSTFAEYHVELQPVYSTAKHHTGYALKLMIGSPEKEFTVLLDTVTAFLWVAGSSSQHTFCHAKTAYSNFDSRTCTTVIPSPQTQFRGMKSVTVCMWNDNISINSCNSGRLNFINSPFGSLCTLQWPELEDYQQIDGVFGLSALHVDGIVQGVLGLPSLYGTDDVSQLPKIGDIADNPLKKAIREKQLNPIITIALPSLDAGESAMLTLGGRNNELCDLGNEKTESLAYFANRYDFEYLAIKLGNATYKNKLQRIFAYPHITKPYIAVPDQFMREIVRNLKAEMDPETKKYMVDCQESFAPFVMQTHKNNYIIGSEHFIIKHNEDERCELVFRSNKNIFDESVALGIPFFHQYCVTLEPRDKRINFTPITQSLSLTNPLIIFD